MKHHNQWKYLFTVWGMGCIMACNGDETAVFDALAKIEAQGDTAATVALKRLEQMKQTVDVDACLEKGDLAPVNAWLEEHIWKFGCLYKPAELLERALGEPFDPAYYVRYLTEKYTKLYSL